MMETVWEVLAETLEESLLVLVILFGANLLIEYIEHRASSRFEHLIRRAGRMGPLFGGLLGVIPQCGFSGATAQLYASRTVTAGTLFAVILTTSDEMLSVMLGEQVPLGKVLTILGIKFVVGVAVGFAVDLVLRKRRRVEVGEAVGNFNKEHETTHHHGILKGAVVHTVTIYLMILAVSFLLSLTFEWLGEETIASWVPQTPFVAELIAGLVGIIPNCTASVFLTELYVKGVIGMGPLLSGLFVNGGIALLVLWKSNRNKKENLVFTLTLYAVSVVLGTLIGLFPIG